MYIRMLRRRCMFICMHVYVLFVITYYIIISHTIHTAISTGQEKQALALSLYTQLTQEYQLLTDKLVEMRENNLCKVEEATVDKDKKLAMV